MEKPDRQSAIIDLEHRLLNALDAYVFALKGIEQQDAEDSISDRVKKIKQDIKKLKITN